MNKLKRCLNCNKIFDRPLRSKKSKWKVSWYYYKKMKCCSNKCKGEWRSKNITGKNNWNWRGGDIRKKCEFCGKEFFIERWRKDTAKFCSYKCHGNDLKDRLNTRLQGENHWNWKGGRKNDKKYIRIYQPEHPNCDHKGYILEHRFVMEKKIGRYLTKQEIIHHINEIKTDNRPENLMLFSSIKEHIIFHCRK